MRLYSEKQCRLFNIGTKLKFNLIDEGINEIIEGKVIDNYEKYEEVFINCKYGEYQYDYKELKEALR